MLERLLASEAKELTINKLTMLKTKSLEKVNTELPYIYEYIKNYANEGVFVTSYPWRKGTSFTREEIDILTTTLREDGYNIDWVDPSKYITIRW